MIIIGLHGFGFGLIVEENWSYQNYQPNLTPSERVTLLRRRSSQLVQQARTSGEYNTQKAPLTPLVLLVPAFPETSQPNTTPQPRLSTTASESVGLLPPGYSPHHTIAAGELRNYGTILDMAVRVTDNEILRDLPVPGSGIMSTYSLPTTPRRQDSINSSILRTSGQPSSANKTHNNVRFFFP